jgi:hypothetical protein
MSIPQVDLRKLEAVHTSLAGVSYKLGAKPGSLTYLPTAIHYLDCSGAVRYLLYNATSGQLVIPDGSWYQREWCEDHLIQIPYGTVANAGRERLFIAFITAGVNGSGETGHVWLVHNGKTLESYGGHGIGRRNWDYRVLREQVHKCFELPAYIPPLLILNGKVVQDAYLAGGHWFARAGELSTILGGTTQTPDLPVPVMETAESWGWNKLAYTDRLVTDQRAYLNVVRITNVHPKG